MQVLWLYMNFSMCINYELLSPSFFFNSNLRGEKSLAYPHNIFTKHISEMINFMWPWCKLSVFATWKRPQNMFSIKTSEQYFYIMQCVMIFVNCWTVIKLDDIVNCYGSLVQCNIWLDEGDHKHSCYSSALSVQCITVCFHIKRGFIVVCTSVFLKPKKQNLKYIIPLFTNKYPN